MCVYVYMCTCVTAMYVRSGKFDGGKYCLIGLVLHTNSCWSWMATNLSIRIAHQNFAPYDKHKQCVRQWLLFLLSGYIVRTRAAANIRFVRIFVRILVFE